MAASSLLKSKLALLNPEFPDDALRNFNDWRKLEMIYRRGEDGDGRNGLKMLAKKDGSGMTALHKAAKEGIYDSVAKLLEIVNTDCENNPSSENWLSVDAESNLGTPLSVALKAGQYHVACLLILNGATPSFPCGKLQESPLSCLERPRFDWTPHSEEIKMVVRDAAKGDLNPAKIYLQKK